MELYICSKLKTGSELLTFETLTQEVVNSVASWEKIKPRVYGYKHSVYD